MRYGVVSSVETNTTTYPNSAWNGNSFAAV